MTDSNGNTYTKKLDGAATTGHKATLVPGLVHRLASLPHINPSTDWNPSNWMVNIPRNVYLSEISIPGSWNSLNADFQSNVKSSNGTYREHSDIIAEQYNEGVRAFHLDTRWKRYRSSILQDYTYTLSVADGRAETSVLGSSTGYAADNNPTVAEVLSDLKSHIQNNREEYMILYCTFAQGSKEPTDAGEWEKAIYNLCANDAQLVMANEIDENTTVADVKGKILVMVNTDANSVSSVDRPVYFNYDMVLTSSMVSTRSPLYRNGTFTDNTGITIYGTHAQVTSNGTSAYDDVDGRGYAPTIEQRTNAINAILDASQTNYANQLSYAHNTWYYLGVGGYTCNRYGNNVNYTAVDPLRQIIDTRIGNMAARPTGTQTAFYPVGIVLMNNAVTNSTTCDNILQLNNKYQKAYDADRSPVDGSSVGGSSRTNISTNRAPSMTVSSTNAIGY